MSRTVPELDENAQPDSVSRTAPGPASAPRERTPGREATVAFGSPVGGRVVTANTIVEVAALAGVSPATVSRALRGLRGVSAPTRVRVIDAAAQLGYVASPSAAALTTGRTQAIAVLAPWVSRWFFGAVIDGAQEVLSRRGYDVLLYPLDGSVDDGPAAPGVRSLDKRVDGVLALNVPLGLQSVQTLLALRVPVVTVGSMIESVPAVLVDNVLVGRLATEHLLGLGHRCIAFLGSDPAEAFGFTVAGDRAAGYRAAMAGAGAPIDGGWCPSTGFAVEGGSIAFERMWGSVVAGDTPAPSAVVAVSDEVAMGVLHAARRLGLDVPGDLSVVGVDNHDLGYLFDLTTVAQPVRDQGRMAARLLLDQLTPDPGPSHTAEITPHLIVRGTTAPPSGRSTN
ncbi:LacI family DNA-binding transcriptional regulator [Nakamurella flavida]|uniref:LacI family DNA-binding transcriptional regulator n=1 Tax=Nakamurella flavida TaxID=363630 RepID=A0A938YQE6_9ACTN|nr:LacI family DNA-binding transcriptional regulator [Nakamurella flavida]MBM9477552.1 LacI family DNA-binding transcriptional regulator [Nakamurella flavida]MDP9779100.1 DNA-binding LacI/PurR family transcriptional regulator [Nakamurella flavida]